MSYKLLQAISPLETKYAPVYKSNTTFHSLSRASCLVLTELLIWSLLVNRGLLYMTRWSSTCLEPSSPLSKTKNILPYFPSQLQSTKKGRCIFTLEIMTFGTLLASENSRHLATLPLVSPPNDVCSQWETSAEIPYCFWFVESNFPRGATNQKQDPDLGNDASSVWNFYPRFSHVIWRRNQW